ncbi:MAG: hypothetical protein NZ585_05120 [Chloracidobacterium sp.]|nr:hypothetical protein [Chloracidobacterium sp.]
MTPKPPSLFQLHAQISPLFSKTVFASLPISKVGCKPPNHGNSFNPVEKSFLPAGTVSCDGGVYG